MIHDKEFYENLYKETNNAIDNMGTLNFLANSISVSIGLFKEILVDTITLFEKLEKEAKENGTSV